MNVQISIVIPVYNGEKYINSCINKLQDQILKVGYEIIFINDGSVDNTEKIICEYAQNDERIRLVSQENRGVSAARNRGIKEAKGEWIVFVDVDDDIAPEYIQDISQEIEKEPSSHIFVYARHYVKKDSKVIDTKKFTREELICSLLTEEIIEELGTDYLLFAVWSKVYKKDFLLKNNIFFAEGLKWGEDLLFQCRAFQCAADIRFIYRGFYRYVQNSNSVIHRFRKDDTVTVKKMQSEVREALAPIWDKEGVKRAYYKSMLNRWFIAISSELQAWKQEESFWSAYKHLTEILQEKQVKDIMENVNMMELEKKNKLKLFLLQRFKIIYLLMVRKMK